MTVTLPRRDELDERYTWDVESIFPSPEAWAEAVAQIDARLPMLAAHAGKLGDSPQALLAWFTDLSAMIPQVRRVAVYTSMSRDVDTTNQQAAARYEQARGLYARFNATIAFSEPELLALGRERLDALIAGLPELATYRQYVDELFSRAAHVRSAEVEELLGQVSNVLRSSATIHSTLTDGELEFGTVRDSQGHEVLVAQGTLQAILGSSDRELRRAAWEAYADGHLRFKNTLAGCISGGVKANVFNARARGYGSALEAAVTEDHVPVAVFHNVLDTYRRNLHVWHRYWKVRRKALGVETLHTYDLWAPISKRPPHVSYEQSVDWIAEGMKPLGEEYVSIMRDGSLEQRWVDVLPNQGKRTGAYSSGAPGIHPFIFMSYSPDLWSMSTLAHELGHSMHSFLTWREQPTIYANYTIFLAEVASNFNQALVRAHLLSTNDDPEFQIAVIEEAMSNFLRYFFIMPILARFEHEIHTRIERGGALTADQMSALLADLYAEGYGSEAVVDRDRDGITWAEFSIHMYLNFYVYQYATGIAAANALADRVLTGEEGLVERYLGFLKSGSSRYPMDTLQAVGVDLTTPEPIERSFRVLEGLVERLEQLIEARDNGAREVA